MGYQEGICTKEDKDHSFGREGRLWQLSGFTKIFVDYMKQDKIITDILFIIIGIHYYSSLLLFENRAARKTFTIGLQKSPFPSRQYTSLFLCSCRRKIDGIKIPIRSASLLFFRFGFLELLLVPQFEEMASGRFYSNQEVIAEMKCLFCTVEPILLFGRD